MSKQISRYTLASDIFTNLCYLYDHNCVCTLENRWIHVYPINTEGLGTLCELQSILNGASDEWKESMLEIEEE